jgi:hypothetical protein
MSWLRIPTLYHPAEISPGVRTAFKIIASQTKFPNPKNPDHLKARRGEVAEAIAAADLSLRYGMITNGAFIGRKELPWERRFPQVITTTA